MHIQSCEGLTEFISVKFSNDKTHKFSLFWLRDHSTDAKSLNENTLQRDVETFSLPNNPLIQDVLIINHGQKLQIHWQADAVISEFDAEFLYRMAFKQEAKPAYQLWSNELQDNIPDFDFDEEWTGSDDVSTIIAGFNVRF